LRHRQFPLWLYKYCNCVKVVAEVGAGGLETQPKVTVALALYNGQEYLRAAVESIARQSFDDFELLVVDDGSADGGPEIVSGLAAADPRIRLIRAEHGGIARVTNRALAEARGMYFAPMDQDDVALPHRLAATVAFLERRPDVVAGSGGATEIDSDGSALAGPVARNLPVDAAAAMQRRCALLHPASLMRTHELRAIGGYRANFDFAHDYDLFLRLGERGGLANLPETILLKRKHDRQVPRQRADRAAQVVAGAVAYMSHVARTEFDEDIIGGTTKLHEAGARFVVRYLEGGRPLRPDLLHHFGRFLRYARLHHNGRREPASTYLRYLSAAARAGGMRELLRNGYYLATYPVSPTRLPTYLTGITPSVRG